MTAGLLQGVGLTQGLLEPALAGEHENQRKQCSAQIEPERCVLDVPIIQRAFFFCGYKIAAIDLRPTRNTRTDQKAEIAIAWLVLRQQRPGTDQRHLADQNIEQLRQFIDARPPQEIANPGSIIAVGVGLAFATPVMPIALQAVFVGPVTL